MPEYMNILRMLVMCCRHKKIKSPCCEIEDLSVPKTKKK